VGVGEETRELRWLRRLGEISHRLAAEREVKALYPLIVDAAIDLTEAERGFLVRVAGKGRSGRPKLRIEAARGFDRETLQAGLSKVSRTVVERALDQKRGVVTTMEEDRDLTHLTTLQKRRVRSVACVPLITRSGVAGVLYLDHRFDTEAFTEAELPALTAFADQAALALETAQLQQSRSEQRTQRADTERQLARLESQSSGRHHGRALTLPDDVEPYRHGELVGSSESMRQLYGELERVARSRAPVSITGESGTGKELVARELHRRGTTPQEPFLSENCAALAENLLEAELFGHARGAYTGAEGSRPGLFVSAGEGTLFLDEIAETSPSMQAKLLRVLQEERVRPVGGGDTVPTRCRVVVATHQDLRQLAADGRFRQDLLYRLDVLRLSLPPLRDRLDDLPQLLAHFLQREGRQMVFSAEALTALSSHRWPGNVRELENEVRRLVAADLTRVEPGNLSLGKRSGRTSYAAKTLPEVERDMILAALQAADGNKSRAARELGIPRGTLYHLMQQHGIEG
jgi:transcriptional regulator with GAF, ATPase, and Fis domain